MAWVDSRVCKSAWARARARDRIVFYDLSLGVGLARGQG